MRAALCRAFGGPDAIEVADLPDPVPATGEVVARVRAAGMNFADLLMAQGRYQVTPPLPYVPGLEFAGEVVAVGSGVADFRPGDRVAGAPLTGGCFAEYVAVPAARTVHVPDDLPLPLAAGILVGHGTASYALRWRGRLKPGETVVISGAGGGVGTAAIAVARRMGARVIAAASAAKRETAGEADAFIDYTSEDLTARLKALTGGRGVAVALDLVGGTVFDSMLRAMAPLGRLLVVGFASGELPRISSERILIKNLTVEGVGFGGVIGTVPGLGQEVADHVVTLHRAQPFADGPAEFVTLGDVGLALGRMAARQVRGKLLVRP
ncbi:MAG: NADPH:quinone oxidoreductase family protein [Alphaproteobacteria bacterium]|nr:NADPH:quinone oxidoreductase family protein [Alphaproteobacteria bacterium]